MNNKSKKPCCEMHLPMEVSRLEFDFENPAMFPEFDIDLLKPKCKHKKTTRNEAGGVFFLQCCECKEDLGNCD